jgi:hypothetical protein
VIIYAELNENKVIMSYASNKDLIRKIEIETDIDLNTIDIVENYKLEDGKLIELTDEEKEANKIDICPGKTVEERLLEAEIENKKLKQHQEFIEECLMEMAQIVYS